ncbi:MAG: hypothetical protein GX421_01560 [Caldisericales bacterium]|nr:hypothetical protein [Caldisericales bacterium]
MIIVWGFVMFFLLLGFPFFVLVVARKQEGWMKYAGWVLAGLFTLFLLVTGVFAISRIGNGRMGMMASGGMGCQMMGGGPGKMMVKGGMCGGPGMMGGAGCCPMMNDDGAEWDKFGFDEDGNALFERQGPKMMIRMFNKDMFQDEKNIDSFIENLRENQKAFDQFKTKINAPAPKKNTTTTKTPATPTPTTPKNP